jgi:hypothetical protein
VALVTLWWMLLLGPTAQANNPSLADTLLWMHDFVAANGRANSRQDSDTNQVCTTGEHCEERIDKFHFESKGCSATITHDLTIAKVLESKETHTFNLKDLDPNTVFVEDDKTFQGVFATTFNDKDLIKYTDRGVLNGERVTSNLDAHTAYVGFRDTQAAQRFAKAWKHAIAICGGKPSAF